MVTGYLCLRQRLLFIYSLRALFFKIILYSFHTALVLRMLGISEGFEMFY